MADRTEVTLRNPKVYRSFITNGRHIVEADEPEDFGGFDSAMNPVELVLAGLAECKAVTVRAKAAQLGVELGEIRASVAIETGKGEGRALASKVDVKLDWDGATSEQQREKILASASRCFVHRMLQGSFDIETRYND
jgi:putative redox protein